MRYWAGLIVAIGMLAGAAKAAPVTLYDGRVVVPVIHEDTQTSALAADMLAHDLESLTGGEARVSATLSNCGRVCIVIGQIDSPLVAQVARQGGLDLSSLKGQWERYERVAVTRGDRTWLPQGMRLAVSLDGRPIQTLDFATVGRSDEWRENVLSNRAVRTIALKSLTPGKHRLEVFARDPGLMLDHIEIDLDGSTVHYGAAPAT